MKTIEWNITTEILRITDGLKRAILSDPSLGYAYHLGYTDALSDVRAAVLKIREDLDEYPEPDYLEPEFDDE